MISNAFKFNMPHRHVYKEAKKLRLLGLKAFQFFKDSLILDDKYLLNYQDKNSILATQ